MAAASFEAQWMLSNKGVVVHALAVMQSSIHVYRISEKRLDTYAATRAVNHITVR